MEKQSCPNLPDLLWTIGKFLREAEVPPGQREMQAAAVKALNQLLDAFYPRELKLARCGNLKVVPNLLAEEIDQIVPPPPKTR